MEESRRLALLEDAITGKYEVSSTQVLLAVLLCPAVGAAAVWALVWLLGKPLTELPVPYAIVFLAVTLSAALTIAAAYIAQSIEGLVRGAKAIALSALSGREHR